ncbi:MAG TPA: 3-ketoacyl-ACP reductase [Cyclobacteriaceae bacterium]|nr:3-ketoacyl-ACP reductase [Cyclobacteriaceae bacterium]
MKKTALITGGTRGIGLGIARCLADEGYDLALNGIREEDKVKTILDELATKGIKVIYCRGNVGDRKDREKIISCIKENFSHLNLLVNNAGIPPRVRNDILEATEESFEEIIRTNLQGPYFLTQYMAKLMIAGKKKNKEIESLIINISSVSSTMASVNRGDYCISKAGISMASQLWAVRLAEFGIPVFEIRPGIVDTDMTRPVKEKYDKMLNEGLTLQNRWGKPEDVGKVVVMLAKGYLSYSTGQVIMVDGGMTVGRL